jgi:hypothetical protein
MTRFFFLLLDTFSQPGLRKSVDCLSSKGGPGLVQAPTLAPVRTSGLTPTKR